jgi:isocitrate/isopropylmalate dehydrogenase
MKTVVALPGEGIGPEVVDATCELLLGTGLPLKILTPPQGAAAVKSHGESLSEETKRAPDIAGRGIANPTATIRSAAMMLHHMDLGAEADRVDAAVARIYRDGKTLTPDQGGTASTRDMARAVLAAYQNA